MVDAVMASGKVRGLQGIAPLAQVSIADGQGSGSGRLHPPGKDCQRVFFFREGARGREGERGGGGIPLWFIDGLRLQMD